MHEIVLCNFEQSTIIQGDIFGSGAGPASDATDDVASDEVAHGAVAHDEIAERLCYPSPASKVRDAGGRSIGVINRRTSKAGTSEAQPGDDEELHLDPLLLSRIQFAWVIGWHILLPAFTVGLASFIAFLEGGYALTKRPIFLDLSQFWLRIFAISFGMGVVTGIVMPFQLGTNWSRFADDTGNVISPLLAYEGLTAFFLEATFLGVLLFGRKLVPPTMHFVAAVLVAAGTLSSSFWILATNSWMQTPVGHAIVDGRFLPQDWLEIVFNPSFPYRLAHTVSAFFVTTAFVVLGVGAYTVRRGQSVEHGRLMLRLALWFLAIFVPAQVVIGDLHGLNTLAYQPAKLAAIEGLWDGGNGVAASIIGWPDQAAERNLGEIAIPRLGSLYLTHSWDGAVKGLKDFPTDQRPPVAIVYFTFRIMVGIALLMLAVVVAGFVLMAQGRLDRTGWYLRLCQLTSCLGFIAVIAGWTTTEVGRQPWTVYGLMRTADSVSPSLAGSDVVLSLLLYVAVYLLIYPVGLYTMLRVVWRGPVAADAAEPIAAGHHMAPIEALSAATPETAR
jgi:cytochrome d ubiquinol oxidase subunit I